MTWVRSPPHLHIQHTHYSHPATRIIAAWYLLHQDDPSYPTTNFDAFLPDNEATNEHIDVQDDHYKLVREMGAASTVLLKNKNHALPLKKPRNLVLIGSDAGPGKIGPDQFADQVIQVQIMFFGCVVDIVLI
jgi:beta-glucosidase-like glycosyl hydrolase